MKSKEAKTTIYKGKPIFTKILIPVIVLVIIEILLLVSSIFGGGLTSHLNRNAEDILREKVLNRQSYLESEMVDSWSQISSTAEKINAAAEAMAQSGELSPSELDSDIAGSAELLAAVADDVIAMMRSCKVTGGFVVLNNEELSQTSGTGLRNKSGLYLRDLDPVSSPSLQNTDLLLERAPVKVAQKLGISLDSGWQPQFQFEAGAADYYEFLKVPYEEARLNKEKHLSYQDFGYWSSPYSLNGDEKQVIAYSIPLILDDGTVYGVLGVDITLDYLQRILPYRELADDKKGSYILGIQKDGGQFLPVLINGPVFKQAGGSSELTNVEEEGGSYRLTVGEQIFRCAVEPLELYSTNAPFSSDRWVLAGAMREQDLFEFSHRIAMTMLTAIFFTLLAGVAGSLLVSRIVSRPVEALVRDIGELDGRSAIDLRRTGIREIDELETSIEALSRDVIDSAAKFAQIIEMASVKIAGFEMKKKERQLFVTSGFFEIFQIKGIDMQALTLEQFGEIMYGLQEYLRESDSSEGKILFQLPQEDGGECFVSLKYSDGEERCIGLAEDVTQTIVEKELIEYERDHDSLTGLINRRAFSSRMKKLFNEEKEALGHAALVMLDLDNLKKLNDTYGHDCGDTYIKKAAECFRESVPEGTIVSRISGDEFYLFFYGYEDKEEIRRLLEALKQATKQKTILLPDQQQTYVLASGGIAWYPDDSTEYEELLRYSDFAMYRVKQSQKGEMYEFDIGVYNKEAFLTQNRAELSRLLEESLVYYCFQPIVSVKDGEIFAYEALMRANLPTIHSAADIVMLAREEGKLDQIERITWFKSMKSFAEHIEKGRVDRDCRIFINSIPSERMEDELIQEFEETFAGLLENIVLEMTEEDRMNGDSLQVKRRKIVEWGAEMALDDYGSGYNSEKLLLQLAPRYVKIDRSIITNINSDPDKQKLVENVAAYAHERNMYVVAEGVENREEAEKVIRLGVDYLQGYWIAKPEQIPPGIASETKQQILSISKTVHSRGQSSGTTQSGR